MPSELGGMSRHCEEVYSRLARRGHDVTVFSTKTHDRAEYRGMKLRRVRSVRLPGWERLGYSFVAAVVSMWGPFDLVHFHSYSSSGFCFAPKLARKKVAVTVHRLEWQDAKWRGPARAFLRFCERMAARWADVLITVSKNFELDLRNRYPHAKNIHYVPNGVTVPEHGDPDACKRLGLTPGAYALAVGRLVPEKGFDVAIDAVGALGDAGKGFELAIAGDAPHDNEYLRGLRTRAERSTTPVRLLGIQSPAALATLYESARLFVAPSYHEGQSLTVLEAMSHGCCIVASDIDANRELVADSGLLFPAGDAGALAALLRELLADTARVREIGDRARSRMEHGREFDWDQVAETTDAILTAL
jgi:glycosyltransferase involved in cell wall biosynthesis